MRRNHPKIKRTSGFTIVELLVTIVVIGILSSITIVAFNGIQERALNASRHSEVVAWEKNLQLYKATYGQYPPVTSGEYCLGTGFPGGKCRDYQADGADPDAVAYDEANSAQLHTELKKISSLPSGTRKPVSGVVGPYINIWGTGYYLEQTFQSGVEDCPTNMEVSWFDPGDKLLICYIEHME